MGSLLIEKRNTENKTKIHNFLESDQVMRLAANHIRP